MEKSGQDKKRCRMTTGQETIKCVGMVQYGRMPQGGQDRTYQIGNGMATATGDLFTASSHTRAQKHPLT